MAEQRIGEVRNKKTLKLTDADEGDQKIDNSGGDGWGGLFTPEYFKRLNSDRDAYSLLDRNIGALDIHGGDKFPGNDVSGVGGGKVHRLLSADEDAQFISDFFESNFVDDDNAGIVTTTTDKLLLDQNFQNLDFGGAGKKNDDEREGLVGPGIVIRTRLPYSGVSGCNLHGTRPRRIRLSRVLKGDSVGDEDSEKQEFGRDTNRLDYFSVTAFDVDGDDHLTGIASHGGGGGGGIRGGDTAVARGGVSLQQGPVRFSGNTCSEAVVERLDQERGNGGGGRRGRRLMGGTRLEQERGSATARAGGGDRTREIPGGIFGNNGSDGGEAIVKILKHEGATVAVPVVVVQAVAVMMMVMVIGMVSVMVKKEVWW